jgi:hypothetical protein
MESPHEIKPEEPPDPIQFEDTAVGLLQPPDVPDEDEPTEELPSSPLVDLDEDENKD